MIFLADVVFNKLFFYADWNTYPQHFLTALHDSEDIIVVSGDDAVYHYRGGSYYIRVRPDFSLYDFLSDRRYIYNMYAFSQPPASDDDELRAYETMELSHEYLGYVNQSRVQDYRYFQIDMAAVYDIKLKRLPLQGKPRFYIKIMDDDKGYPPRKNNYHYRSEADPDFTESRQ